MRIIETLDAVERCEDWSKVRSPGRARRRQRYGHRQNVRIVLKPAAYQMGATMFVHPLIAAELRRQTIEACDRSMVSAFYNGVLPSPIAGMRTASRETPKSNGPPCCHQGGP